MMSDDAGSQIRKAQIRISHRRLNSWKVVLGQRRDRKQQDEAGNNNDLHHKISSLPSRWFATLAMTNKKSESRFRYSMTFGFTSTFSDRFTTRRSARRHTVRATCNNAPPFPPPARMN